MKKFIVKSLCIALMAIGNVCNIFAQTTPPNDEIWYEAPKKLIEAIGTGYSANGLHLDAFNTTIASHTFSGGKGIIKFNGNVTSIGDYAFYECSNLFTSITIPNSVTSIGDYAFCGCSGLTSITIPNSVTSIGDYAFFSCSGLTSITIPNSVTSIGGDAFSNCKDLNSITVSKDNEIFDSRNNCNSIIESATNTLIVGCKNTLIPNSVTSIENSAFDWCTSLASITIPNSVTSIGNSAFNRCTSLASITIPDSVTSIGEYAFSHCSSLVSVTIGNSVTSIGGRAFSSCSSLASITIGNSVTRIGDVAFSSCSSLTSITIPNSVTSIGSYAFEYCSSLAYVIIPNSVTSIGEWAFKNCSSLASITVYDEVSMGVYPFYGCSNVKELIYAEGTKTAWRVGITTIERVTIPNSVTSIGGGAFENCSSLASVTNLATMPQKIDANTFSNYGTLHVYESLKELYKADTIWGNFTVVDDVPIQRTTSIALDKTTAAMLVDDTLTLKTTVLPENATIKAISWTSSNDEVASVDENGVVTAKSCGTAKITATSRDGSDISASCEVKVTEQTPPNDEIWYTSTNGKVITPHKTNVFGASIVSNTYTGGKGIIKFNGNVTSIGVAAFYDCDGLISITIPNSVTSIEGEAFYSCSSLTSVTIPNSVKSIGGSSMGRGAFAYCSRLTSVTIPNSVTSIGQNAFRGCSNLSAVHINSLESWCKIKFGYEDANPTIYAHKLYLNNVEIKDLVIPSTIETINDFAFRGCTSLTSITLPNSVISMGEAAFADCSSLTSITLPNSVTSIGIYAFWNCSNLPVENNIRYADSYLVEAVDKQLSSYTIKEGTRWIGDRAFENCSSLTSITIPNSVTSIGYYAFDNCSSLPVIDNIRYADTYLVEVTDKTLSSYTIKEGTKWICYGAFYGCSSLTSITLPNSVTSIGNSAFAYCSNLASITLPNSVTSIGKYAFGDCSSLGSATIGNSVMSIEDYTFENCSSLTSITIPNSVTSIGGFAFVNCSSLASITLPNSVTSIESYAFRGCSSLASITNLATMPQTIDSYCFSNYSATLYVYEGLKSVYQNAANWNNFTIVDNVPPPTKATSITIDASIYYCKVSGTISPSATVNPEATVKIFTWESSDPSVLLITDANTGQASGLKEGVVTITAKTKDGSNLSASATVHVYIPVTSIALNQETATLAIAATLSLSATVLPETATIKAISWTSSNDEVASVDENGVVTAKSCGTAKITATSRDGSDISASCEVRVTQTPPNDEIWYSTTDGKIIHPQLTIEDPYGSSHTISLFGLNVELISNTYQNGHGILKFNNEVTQVGDVGVFRPIAISGPFMQCKTLSTIILPNSVKDIGQCAFSGCSNLTLIEFPNSVSTIDSWAFSSCSLLSSIKIPTSVTSIGEGAFYCCSSLTAISIPSSVEAIYDDILYGCVGLTEIICLPTTPPNTLSHYGYDINPFENTNNCPIYVPEASISTYKTAWNTCANRIHPIPYVKEGVIYTILTSTRGGIIWDGSSVKFSGSISSAALDSNNPNHQFTFIKKEDTDNQYYMVNIGSERFLCQNNEDAFLTADAKDFVTFNSIENESYPLMIKVSSGDNLNVRANGELAINDYSNPDDGNCFKLEAVGQVDASYLAELKRRIINRCNLITYTSTDNQIVTPTTTVFGDATILSNTYIKSQGVIAFDKDLTEIAEEAFSGCENLKSMELPARVKKIGDSSFDGCANLSSVNIPDSVLNIGKSAFRDCYCLSSISIPGFVTSIDGYAFKGCSALGNVYCYAKEVPSSVTNIFNNTATNKTLYVHKCAIDTYRSTSPWDVFTSYVNLPYNILLTNIDNVSDDCNLVEGDSYSLTDSLKYLEITSSIPSVNLTYTRSFSDAMVGNWQAWYMPCDFDYDDLSEDFDVAEVAGVLFDQDGQNYVAFRKMTEGTVKAHTPYVVRAKKAGDAIITATTTLQPTSGAKSFSMQSAFNNFTFGGVYENSYLSAEQPTYALLKTGNFGLMASDVYLRPFRIYMRIADREDNPYAAVTAPQEVKVVVLGEDETSIENVDVDADVDGEIYNLAGQKLQKLQKGINIVNGKKVLF